MRSVLYTLQRLKDQEKKQRQRELAQAQRDLQEKQNLCDEMTREMYNERSKMPKTAGEMREHDRMLVHRYYALCRSEEDLQVQEENVQVCQEALLFARQQSKINEKLVESMERDLAKERKHKETQQADELGVMGWWRNQGLLD
jgi:flagellar export protein FliJ